MWTRLAQDLHTFGHPWLSASIASFTVAVLLALPFAASKPGQSRRRPASKNNHP